ncbi:multidrug resistance protein homolog 49-like isoform X2 [Zootermopsis nevadensis]|nr:multidrug resistance protein homolog 49-like isoform X2 [Zootermopsis nevadensis]XP_021920942.1 multidrug resistance protein homolog 49-like isoform X2 [Zootermopsis nevadensis]
MHQNSDKTNAVELIMTRDGKNENLKIGGNSLNIDTMASKDRTKKERKDDVPNYESVAFHRLFRYATYLERFFIFFGLLLSIFSGIGIPLIIMLYGEFTTLLVDRSQDNVTSSPTTVLNIFGGGRQLINGSYEERNEALMEDSAAFGLGCTVVGIVQFAIGSSSIAVLNFVAQKQIGRVRKLFLQAVLRQDMTWYDTTKTANFASRITEDLDKMQDGIGEKMSIFVYLITIFVASVIMSFLNGWKLTLVVISCAPIIIVAQSVVSKVQTSLTEQELESYGDAGAVVEEVLSSLRTVVAFAGEDKEVARYTDKLSKAKATGIKRGMFSGLGAGIMWFIIYCSYAIAFWYGVNLILESREKGDHEYTPAILVIVLFGVLSGAMNMGMASPHLEAFAVARGSAAAVFSVLDRVPYIDSLSKAGQKPSQLKGVIQLQGVHFQYPARPEVEVLHGLNLTVKSGESVALIGPSGCGKSTIIQLVQRFYDPSEGKVLLDGIDVKQLNVGWMRGHIGVVGQEPVLFATTIKENIRYGREDATQKEIEEAARDANAHDFISELPDGYDTMVGDRGAQLSGGQKQRIAIARALIRRPNILLLDEATSALDLHSEAKVQAALDRASKGRTTLVVTHRLSTVKNADRIVYISGGQVKEQGTHTELMAHKGHYFALVNADSTLTEGAGSGEMKLPKNDSAISAESLTQQFSAESQAGISKGPVEVADQDAEEEQYEAPLSRILALNKPEWLHSVVGCLAAAAVGSTLPGYAVLFGEVIGVLENPDAEEVQSLVSLYCILFVVVGVVTGLGMFLQIYLFGLVGVRLTERLRVAVFGAVLRQEVGWFDEQRNQVGTLCARLSGDAASVQGATGSRIGVILQVTSTLVIGILLSFIYSWKMTLVSVIPVPFIFVGIFIEARVMHGQGLKEKIALETAAKIAVEAIANIRTVTSLCGEQLFLERYMTELLSAQQAARRKTYLRGPVFSFGQTVPFFGYGLSLYYGGYLVSTEGLPYKNVIKVSEVLIFGAWMLGQGLAFVPNYNTAKMAAGRMFRLMDRKPRIYSPQVTGSSYWEATGNVEYLKVEFHYPTRPEVQILRGLNLRICPGQTMALVGSSGCGKSTCIQLLQRFYEPSAGTVNINGEDISTVQLDRLRAQFGIVSQEPVLFDRTIAENIAYGDNSREVPMEEIIDAAKKSNIHNFISSLPLGYETRLGSKGTQLSGGQKQRIAIARALVRNPRVLLLDEATSALDTHSEKVVQAALDQAREGRTCITIAHRLATVQQADVICVLNQGVVAEMGSHSELLEKQGLYCQLLRQAASNIIQ